MDRPASPSGRPRFDIADIVRAHRSRLEALQTLSAAQRRALSAIERCRTAALGGHLDFCPACGHEHPSYNSCRNRHCPKCQHLAQERWITDRAERLLPVPHFHVVFTLPSALRPLARRFPRQVFGALSRATTETLLDLGRSRLDATLGVTTVLHTWTRDLHFHPHIHAIVTAGGLATDGARWSPTNPKYLFPVKVMGSLLRGKILYALRRLSARGELHGLDPDTLEHTIARAARTDWVVYAKKPFRRSDHVLKYLGRYTHRVAIANSRLVRVTSETVDFHTKDGKIASLDPVEFLHRFVLHILPKGFKKIRHAGLYAAACVYGSLARARALLSPTSQSISPTDVTQLLSWEDKLRELTGRDVTRCPVCGSSLVRIQLPSPVSRSPPVKVSA